MNAENISTGETVCESREEKGQRIWRILDAEFTYLSGRTSETEKTEKQMVKTRHKKSPLLTRSVVNFGCDIEPVSGESEFNPLSGAASIITSEHFLKTTTNFGTR